MGNVLYLDCSFFPFFKIINFCKKEVLKRVEIIARKFGVEVASR
jgi:hypothetical protein